MKQVSTGVGLCVLGLCIVGYPVAERLASRAEAGVPAAVVTVAAAATAQDPPAPTIVWYGTAVDQNSPNWGINIVRAWSNGRVEVCRGFWQWVGNTSPSGQTTYCWTWNNVNSPTGNTTNSVCNGAQWQVISDPAQGLTYRSDINFDEQVNGADLAALLNDWGNARRQDIPPSDCPLALINP